MEEPQRYLRQKGTGRIYVYTETLAKRDDVIECDLDYVEKRIEAAKRRIKEKEEFLRNGKPMQPAVAGASKILAELEVRDQELNEEIERRERAAETVEEEEANTGDIDSDDEAMKKVINEDPEIIKIKEMSKRQVLQYLEEEYGVTANKQDKLSNLRTKAIEHRTVRILEL